MVSRYPRMDAAASDVADVRVHNLLLVLHTIADHGPVARTQVAALTGLSKSSVTALTADLTSRGLIRELDGDHTSVRGRPMANLVIDGSRDAVVAVQLRADDLVVEASDLSGVRRYRAVTPHGRPMNDAPAMARRIAEAVVAACRQLAADQVRVRQIGLVIAGPVAGTPPVIPVAVDFGWTEPVDLVALVSRDVALLWPEGAGLPITVENDASVAALAEREELPAPPQTMVYLKSNTGIGGAAFVHGKLLRGATGFAFEPGHVVVDRDGAPCDCGQRGCLVTVAGPDVVLADAGLTETAATVGMRPALQELVARWAGGDGPARRAVGHLLDWLVPVIVQLYMLFEPERLVLGGYWAGLAPAVRERLGEQLHDARMNTQRARDVVHAAHFGGDGALLGSLLEARWAACADAVAAPLRS